METEAQGSVLPDLALVRDSEDLVVGWSGIHVEGERRPDSGVHRLPWREGAALLEEFVLSVAESFRTAGQGGVYPWICEEHPLNGQDVGGTEALLAFTGRGEESLREVLGLDGSADLWSALGIYSGDPAASIVTQVLRDLPPESGKDLACLALEIQENLEKGASKSEADEVRRIGAEVLRDVAEPEMQGHEAAVALRERFDLDGAPVSTKRLGEILVACGLDVEDVRREVSPGSGDVSSILGALEGRGSAVSLIETPRMARLWARRFEFCRGLGTVMLDSFREGRLGRASCAWASVRNRRRSGAFAAEFLLPVDGLRKRNLWSLDSLAGRRAFGEILNEFKIGARAGAYQLWNLGLLSSAELRNELIEEFAWVEEEED